MTGIDFGIYANANFARKGKESKSAPGDVVLFGDAAVNGSLGGAKKRMLLSMTEEENVTTGDADVVLEASDILFSLNEVTGAGVLQDNMGAMQLASNSRSSWNSKQFGNIL